MISEEKWQQLIKQMDALSIKEADLEEKFILGSSSGGQKLNKTHSCVYLKHRPSNIEVKCQKSRFRQDNRFFARRKLCEEMMHRQGMKTSKDKQIEKLRKQKKRRK